ncbi:MAG: hypothetical protein IT259_12460 [Saprospiraceae bacterium]|nr:hypothetical protein [Saprospiraceae bacterium]
MEKKSQRIAWILLGGFILTYWGLHNGYPFVYPDTGAYIFSGFDGRAPIDRPIAYGLFVRHISMMESAYWVMFAQGILTSLFIYWFMKALLEKVTPALFIGFILVLTLFSDVSVYVSYLMPDLFTPLAYGAMGLILLTPVSNRKAIALGILAFLSLIMHNSNLVGAGILVVLTLIWRMLPANRMIITWKTGLIALSVVFAGWLGGHTLQYIHGGGFTSMGGRHMFMMARLNELGILKNYLDKACAEGKNYRICEFKDQIPDDLLWHPESPANKTGGWEANRDEYNRIIGDIFSDPVYLKTFAVQSINGTAVQFMRFESEHVRESLDNTMPYEAIRQKFPYERYTYSIARQNHFREYLDFMRAAARQELFFLFSLFVGVLLASSAGWREKVPPMVRRMYAFVMMSLVINAFVCSTFSTVVSRYQGRLVWLLFLITLIALWYRFRSFKAPAWLNTAAGNSVNQDL